MINDQLYKEIIAHSTNYYVHGNPDISNEEFDDKVQELKLKFPENDIDATLLRQRELMMHGGKIKHLTPMGTLKSYYNHIECDGALELKIDGIACNLIYSGGNFISGATRGDGKFGVDVTKHVKFLVPQKTSVLIRHEVRGELTGFGVDRAVVAGKMRKIETDVDDLLFVAYDIPHIKERSEMRSTLKENDFTLVKEFTDLPVMEYINIFRSEDSDSVFNSFYKFDGLVVKGEVNIAIKKSGISKQTIVKEILIKNTPTGKTIPILKIEPVILDSRRISRINMNTIDKLKASKIKVGDIIYVTLKGGVLPQIA